MPMRITIGVSPNNPTRCLGGGAGGPIAPPALGSPPVCDPGGGRNSSVSGSTDCFGATLVLVADESGGTAAVESARAPETESGGAVEIESGETADESGVAGAPPGGGSACAAAALAPVEAGAGAPINTAHAATTTNARRKLGSGPRRCIEVILDDERPEGDAKISAAAGSLRTDPGQEGLRRGSGAEDQAICNTTTLPCAPPA